MAKRTKKQHPKSVQKAKAKQEAAKLPFNWINFAILAILAVVWFVFDRIVKNTIEANYSLGQIFVPNNGIFQFDVVHNTGAAWGIFGDSTEMLTTFTLVVVFVIMLFSLYEVPKATKLEMVGLGLLLAGGLGNLFDRLFYGYVVDFITPTFIDYPTFNIADIGVTCGIVILAIAIILQIREGRF